MDYVYRWSIIAQQLPGRTDSDVKNHWNTKLRKKLSETGIDPVTHKPLSQILVDYGNSGGLRKSDTRTSSLNQDLKDAIVLKSEPYPSPPQGFPNINIQVMPSTTSPQTAPTQDTFLNNNETNNITFPPPIFVEESLSSSSSSSPTCSTAAQENSTLDLIWHDFLLDDAFLPADPLEQEIMADHSSKLSASQKHDVIPQNETNKEAATQECLEAKAIDCAVLSDYFPPPSSSDIIFCRCHTRSRISNVVRLPKPFGGAILLLSSLQVDGIETIALEI